MFFVSRQCYYYSNLKCVEVTAGGSDYASADQLVSKYPGEAQEYSDPRIAIENAITICREWRKDGVRKACITVGATCGLGLELEQVTFKEARLWGNKIWAALEKCSCDKPLPEKRKRWRANDYSGEEFCSEFCANREVEWQRINEELNDANI